RRLFVRFRYKIMERFMSTHAWAAIDTPHPPVPVGDPQLCRILPILNDVAHMKKAGFNVVVIGHVALRAFGSGRDIDESVQIAVKDSHLDRLKDWLILHDFHETELFSGTDASVVSLPTVVDNVLTDGVLRFYRGMPDGRLFYLTVCNATLWNLTLGSHYQRSLQYLPMSPIPFCKYRVYLKGMQGLNRSFGAKMTHYATGEIDDITDDMIALCPPELKAAMKPGDKFVAKYFPCPNRTRDWKNYVSQQAVHVYMGRTSFRNAERRLPCTEPVLEAFCETLPKVAKRRRFWRRKKREEEDSPIEEASPFVSIDPRWSITPKHKIYYRWGRLTSKVIGEKKIQLPRVVVAAPMGTAN
ncbi:hypothetical protein KEM55_002816, partial [Ascosphaera atra]